ncbi:MAG: deoxyguanosinetriphosphate triphosphohydrolase [Planctomycetes bacterium]|nr:deoxyguanosinetriphosphate triphosphohydrolase [Myxococcales bacterium]MCB9895136.1 deoxyguanosinetriphosphate triphosphohydrolase [Planctomycetota bacterium]
MNDRKSIEEWELKTLAPYALKACESQGRRHAEDEHPYRTCFQRDRDRIIHCAAFRRLEYKTQVFLNWSGDHFRTRLTHTIEVAQAARTIARSLGLNEDLTEAISLAHDLGHTPFGHAGEHAMRELMKDHGGYEHNGQSLRIVDEIERHYLPRFSGLNPTHELRYGLMKHRTDYDKPLFKDLEERESPSLEAQVANSADEISYNAHDTDDGLYSGLLKWDAARESELFTEAEKYARDNVPEGEEDLLRYQLVRRLKDLQVTDLLQNSAARIADLKVATVQDVLEHQSKEPIIDFSPDFKKKVKGLKLMLYHKLYMHRNVRRGMEKSTRFMKEMFERYVSEPYLMPGGFHKRIADGETVHRVVCDYISGMTDRYALEQYKKLFDPDTW